jgi:hypothetical protein
MFGCFPASQVEPARSALLYPNAIAHGKVYAPHTRGFASGIAY